MSRIKSFCMLLVCSAFAVLARDSDWANFGRYAEANKALIAQPLVEGRVVFIGNSITDGWIMHHPEFFSKNNYVDRGISGQVTEQMLLRFREDVIKLSPDVVVIAGGTNDAAGAAGPFDPEITLGNIKTMVELARAHGIRVVLGSMLPCAEFTWGLMPPDAPATIEMMNSRLRQYADAEGIPFADYYTPLVTGPQKGLNPEWTFDNIHPTLPGYLEMEKVVQPLIERELEKTGKLSRKPRSLDEVERESFHASTSPVDMHGTEMKSVKSGLSRKARASASMSLGGEWQLAVGGSSVPEWGKAIPATVPGSVHAALLDAGIIPDPAIGRNDSIAEKQSYKDWWYRRVFNYDKDWKRVKLSFAGVANKCTVYLNGKKLGKHEGMMGGPDFMIDDELHKGTNELLVHIEAIPEFPAPGANITWTGTVVANCVYGWHYVKIPTLGIWNDVTLNEVPDYPVENPFIFTKSTDGSMRMLLTIPKAAKKGKVNLVVSPKNFDGVGQSYVCDVPDVTGTVAFDFKIDNPQLWWPNGSGEQPLYTATVTYDAGTGVVDRKRVNFGVRTIEMQPMGGSPSEDLYNWKFVVNGRPVFIKGTNWCLMDFMMDLSPERYKRFLGAAKEQHLNLLRAWGGGLVETDLFYDMCDEMGLMVMQEWPTAWNSHKYQNLKVMKETIDRNTYRIRSHPSLVMWAGGNESDDPFGEAIDYMGRVSIERDGTRPFHRGEPWGGSSHNHDSFWLDLHLNNALNMSAVFMGEFGMPSLPVKESVERYLDGEEFRYPLPENTVFEHHGPTFGAWQDMRLLFREVSFTLSPTSLDNMILGSQLAQTLGTRRALERARTLWPDKSAGAVYYKINDVYPGFSWGSVDYYGAKKYTHYFVKRSADPCVPVILFSQTNLTGQDVALEYYLLDDNHSLADRQVTLTASVYDRLMKKLYERDDVLTPAASKVRLPDIRLDKRQTTSPLLYFKVDVKDASGHLVARNWYIQNFDSKNDAIFDAPKCRVNVVQDGNTVTVTNTSDTIPAVAVSFEVPGDAHLFDLSDNMIWIDPHETVSVTMNTSKQAVVAGWNIEK